MASDHSGARSSGCGPVEVAGAGAHLEPVGGERQRTQHLASRADEQVGVHQPRGQQRRDDHRAERGQEPAGPAQPEPWQREPPLRGRLADQQRGDEEAADDEEDVDADEPAGERPRGEVVGDDRHDRARRAARRGRGSDRVAARGSTARASRRGDRVSATRSGSASAPPPPRRVDVVVTRTSRPGHQMHAGLSTTVGADASPSAPTRRAARRARRSELGDRREPQQQPLGAVGAEVDLGDGVRARRPRARRRCRARTSRA